jgi:CheY-like chemotaxis protein
LRPIVAFLDDLFFTVKIADAAKRSGLTVTFEKSRDAVLAHVAQAPSVVVIDLNFASADPIGLSAQIKADSPTTRVIGFVSHVQTELREQARLAGCDAVVPRSVFSTQLPDLLRQYAA